MLGHEGMEAYGVVPEPGQLVEVRRRLWIVVDVDAGEAPGLGGVGQHYVTLSSIEEDGLGESLEVVWEIEPGARVLERAGMPTPSGYDDTQMLEAFLDAVRWGAATNADRGFLQAPFRSGVSIEEFQLDPLVRAIDMARANLLIADDVGLGKTIEAGLVIQELLLRHRARSVFIVCPASLQEKWRVEMLEKFGLEFKIVDTDYVRDLRRERGIHVNPWTSFPRLITSMDWIKSGEALRMLREILPIRASYPRRFDILVVDEAHNVAPAGGGRYAVESLRTRLVKMLSSHFQHRLFLTATPHNGYTESFTSLLELLDDQRFSKNILPDEKQLARVMIRRLKTDLVDKDGNPLYPRRKLQVLPIPYTQDERSIHRTLNGYCESREKTCQGKGSTGTRFVNGLLKKRLFSSPAAFASTLKKHYATLMGDSTQDEPNPLDDRILRKAIQKAEEDYADDAQVDSAHEEAVEVASRRAPLPTDRESELLEEMCRWAQREQHRADSKARAIVDWIESNLRAEGEWNDRRVILFTEYRTTHQWLYEILAPEGYGGDRLAILHGDMDQEDREKVKAAFQTHPKDSELRILLATDAASEGIDLQNYCNCLIHLEIPYNPNVMEQRNGRVDRHGQKGREVLIWHPVDGDDDANDLVGGHRDDIIRSLRKLEAMREDMGSVNPVIAPQMAGLIEGRLSELNTREAEARIEKAKKYVRAERQLKERVAKLREHLDETRHDFHLTPERIEQTVVVGLELADKPPLKPVELIGAPSGTVFEMPPLSGSWARCGEGLRHPHTGAIRPITFDNEVAKGRDDVVLVHLNHRLVQMCLRLLRAEVWALDDVKKIHRVDVRSLPDDELEEAAVVVLSRLVVTGGNHHRLHEELTASGGYLGAKGFRREPRVGVIDRWLELAVEAEPSGALFEALSGIFEREEEGVRRALEARSRERLRYLANTLENRKRKEIEDIELVLDELVRSIEAELNKTEEPEQFELFTPDERTQVTRDHEALKARLGRIPEEREREIEAIEHRYHEFTDRTFPVAIVFLVPESALVGGDRV